MRYERKKLSPAEYELKIRPANAIPMQHPTGHVRWVDPSFKNKCLAFGYKECEVVEETITKAVPKATGAPVPPKPKEK